MKDFDSRLYIESAASYHIIVNFTQLQNRIYQDLQLPLDAYPKIPIGLIVERLILGPSGFFITPRDTNAKCRGINLDPAGNLFDLLDKASLPRKSISANQIGQQIERSTNEPDINIIRNYLELQKELLSQIVTPQTHKPKKLCMWDVVQTLLLHTTPNNTTFYAIEKCHELNLRPYANIYDMLDIEWA